MTPPAPDPSSGPSPTFPGLPVPDQRLLIVVRAPYVAVANAFALVADPEADGAFTNALTRASTPTSQTPVAYWCSWAMSTQQRTNLVAEFGRRVARAITAIPVGGTVRSTDDFWLFEAGEGQWDNDAVLAALGFAVVQSTEA